MFLALAFADLRKAINLADCTVVITLVMSLGLHPKLVARLADLYVHQ